MRPYRAPIDTTRALDRHRRRAAVLGLPLAAAAALTASRVGADVIVVSSCASSGAGSLFDAIQTANTIGARTNVEIQFSAALSGHSIALDAVTLTRSMTITGASGVTIVGSNVNSGALITVAQGAGNVQMSSLSISAPNGIGIDNEATLSLSGTSVFNCTVAGIESNGILSLFHSSVSANPGDGIDSNGQLSVFNSDLSSNKGYGIEGRGSFDLHGTTVDANHSGGILSSGKLLLDNTSVSSNETTGVSSVGQVAVMGGSVISDNLSNGLSVSGSVDIQDSTFARNQGNGISLDGGTTGTVARSTLDHNDGDGVYSSASSVTAVDDTLAYNKGVGLSNHAGVATLLNDTIAYNEENGIKNYTGDADGMTLENTIAALNTWADLAGGYDDLGYNLLGTYDPDTNEHAAGVSVDGLDLGSLGLSSELTNDGGFTALLPLLRGSAAIDGANPIHFPLTDQRGVLRPQPTGGLADIGAYEFLPDGQPSVGNPAPLPSAATMALGLMAGIGAWGHWSARLRRKAVERAG